MARKTVYGYVITLNGISPEGVPAFAFQLYIPERAIEKRLEWFGLDQVRDNRELVWVSMLRDALIHSLPVELTYEWDEKHDIHGDTGKPLFIKVHSTIYRATADKATVTGKVTGISVNESELVKDSIVAPSFANIVLNTPKQISLVLLFQGNDIETEMAQLDLLQIAFETQEEVTITYRKLPLIGDPTNETFNSIVGVQIGAVLLKGPLLNIPGKGKRVGKILKIP